MTYFSIKERNQIIVLPFENYAPVLRRLLMILYFAELFHFVGIYICDGESIVYRGWSGVAAMKYARHHGNDVTLKCICLVYSRYVLKVFSTDFFSNFTFRSWRLGRPVICTWVLNVSGLTLYLEFVKLIIIIKYTLVRLQSLTTNEDGCSSVRFADGAADSSHYKCRKKF